MELMEIPCSIAPLGTSHNLLVICVGPVCDYDVQWYRCLFLEFNNSSILLIWWITTIDRAAGETWKQCNKMRHISRIRMTTQDGKKKRSLHGSVTKNEKENQIKSSEEDEMKLVNKWSGATSLNQQKLQIRNRHIDDLPVELLAFQIALQHPSVMNYLHLMLKETQEWKTDRHSEEVAQTQRPMTKPKTNK